MRVRHRIPSLFSLSMVDVLCCALGCVILLWLLNAKQHDDEAEDQARDSAAFLDQVQAEREQEEATRTSLEANLQEKESRLNAARSDRDRTRALLEELQGELRRVLAARQALEKDLAARQAESASLAGKLKASGTRLATLEANLKGNTERLEKEKTRAGGLSRQLAELDGLVKALRADLDRERALHAAEQNRARGLEKEIGGQKRELAALARTVEELSGAKRALEKGLEAQDKALALALPYRDRWSAAEDRVKVLERDKAFLQGALGRARAAVDGRFAGIQLTGKRVIFLVDTSGSMELVDEDTPAPSKWVGVRNTVAKLMRSLPDLEQFQVIAFAAKTSFPLGGEGAWLANDPKASPEKVLKTLESIKPRGGTNMYDALRAAFRYRDKGLDTIYLLSDGLPNQGDGLPAGSKALKELDRGVLLGRHVRKTLKGDWNAVKPGVPRVKINTVGFFYESPDLGAFLWALARENDGSFVGMSKP